MEELRNWRVLSYEKIVFCSVRKVYEGELN